MLKFPVTLLFRVGGWGLGGCTNPHAEIPCEAIVGVRGEGGGLQIPC